jgi:hypothetical protein
MQGGIAGPKRKGCQHRYEAEADRIKSFYRSEQPGHGGPPCLSATTLSAQVPLF